MILHRFKLFIAKKEKKRVFSNFLSLSFLQAANYIIPLIAIPYLTRVLGAEKFGLVMFAQVFIQYFMLLVDFGMEYTATREVSIHREDKAKVHELFNAVFAIKAILLLFSIIALLTIVLFIPYFVRDKELYLLTFGMVVGQMLFPVWLFQGLEKMKYVTLFNVLTKLLFTGMIFIFISSPEDYPNYAIVNSAGYLFTGVISFLFAIRLIRHHFFIPARKKIRQLFDQTINVFLSNLGSGLYMTSTPFLLGIVTGRNDLVGYFTVAEKAVRGLRYTVTPVTQALFPYLSKRFHTGKLSESIRLLHKITLLTLPLLLAEMLGIILFSKSITRFLTGTNNASIILDLIVLSVILIVGTMNNIYGVLGLINLNMEKYFRNFMLVCGVLNVILCITFSHYFLDLGASISVVITESCLLMLIGRKLYITQRNA